MCYCLTKLTQDRKLRNEPANCVTPVLDQGKADWLQDREGQKQVIWLRKFGNKGGFPSNTLLFPYTLTLQLSLGDSPMVYSINTTCEFVIAAGTR